MSFREYVKMRENLLLPEPLTGTPRPISNACRPLRPKPAQSFTPTVKTVPDAAPHKFVPKIGPAPRHNSPEEDKGPHSSIVHSTG